MATVSAARAASSLAVPGTGILRVAHGTYEHASNLAAATIIEYCRVPAGAVVIGGWFGGDDLDTGTEELNMTIGWAANGVEVADPDGFGDLGVMTGDVSAHLGAAGLWFPLQGTMLTLGPRTFSAETVLTGTVVTDAAATGTGTTTMVVYYYVP
jgi:hypothetical protein